ncbi:hypothetical protein ACPOL_4310 [Acidisarcina polymorpha]|uniref:Uncharacterized protein n=1 Tax=Acidisarcina polymorpha TaxID=2211140 RepID=A0A2Z5G4I1_9BACT|nr:hypothetical protein [Acidisarcina polymorpha]AXC13585.1 hypothetical protein ACPOL_4310 [Acidisarcina polymorpha]
MGYLQPTDYTNFGLDPATTDDRVTAASALMESYCRRTSLNPAQYAERMRLTEGAQTVRLSYLPLVAIPPSSSPLVSINARYARPRRGELIYPVQAEIAWAFGLPGAWTFVDPSTIDWVFDTGELIFPMNILGLPYNEVAITYTVGLMAIGNDVMSACAQIIKNMQSTPSLNVKSSRLDTLQMNYFSNSLIDSQVAALLRPYIANRLG